MKYFIFLSIVLYTYSTIIVKAKLEAENSDINNSKIYQMSSAAFTIFVSGFGDKSFLITAIMATKYNKFLVFISASSALVVMAIFSVFMGVMIPNYIPMYFIDISAVIIFIILGISLILQGNFPTEQEEINEKQILKDEGRGNSFSLKGQIMTFFQVFIMIFSSELGDKSQISTIYLSSNFDVMILFYAVSMAQIILTAIAVLGGKYMASKVSVETLNIMAGALFLIFGMVSLGMIYLQDYKIIMKSVKDYASRIRINEALIPQKEVITSFLKKY
jgi:putative Ca2+/H+ antiporter (TMEM165/GDT1 family)